MLKYPLLCPACKRGYLKIEHHSIYGNPTCYYVDIWVCEYCRFSLLPDNPSERLSKRDQEWDGAWDELMS